MFGTDIRNRGGGGLRQRGLTEQWINRSPKLAVLSKDWRNIQEEWRSEGLEIDLGNWVRKEEIGIGVGEVE